MWRLCVTSATHQAWNGSHSIAGSPQMTPMSEMSKMIILPGYPILNNHNAKYKEKEKKFTIFTSHILSGVSL